MIKDSPKTTLSSSNVMGRTGTPGNSFTTTATSLTGGNASTGFF